MPPAIANHGILFLFLKIIIFPASVMKKDGKVCIIRLSYLDKPSQMPKPYTNMYDQTKRCYWLILNISTIKIEDLLIIQCLISDCICNDA